MLGLRFSRLVHASLAGGSLVLGGCVSRAYDFDDSGGGGNDAESTGTTDGPSTITVTSDPTVGPTTTPTTTTNPTDPTDPTDPDTTTGIPPEMPGPPQLIAVGFLDNSTLALTFSEPLAPPQSVDPTQFRLSGAYAPKGDYYYQYNTYYQEIGNWNGPCDEYCYEYCYDTGCHEECWEYCQPGPPVRIAAISQFPDRPDILQLALDNGVGAGVCSQLTNFPEQWTTGLFIHYTPDGSAPVTDNAGELLGDIGEHWALQPERQWAYNQGTFPFMEPVIPIACPF
jgi:hypothetical protein